MTVTQMMMDMSVLSTNGLVHKWGCTGLPGQAKPPCKKVELYISD